jgi:hypothetical protein
LLSGIKEATMSNEVVLVNVRELLRDLNNIDPQLNKDLRREAKLVAKPMQKAINRRINQIQPLSGMTQQANPNGRTAWGAVKKADTVVIRLRTGRSRTRAVTPLLSLWITSPMTAIADIAGKGSFNKSVSVTREYAYKGGRRRHRVPNGQGQDFVRNLKQRGANNFVYPEVEDSIPITEQQVKLVFEKYARKVNRKIS